ncbi:FAD-dependent oxidoreductase [Micromonospora mangrovi]|uniref:FAD-dependent oxidoreductase n=2 Tax=Micromonospora TaxID=1873 RepID=A0AAU7M3J4_9ACTN
MAWAALTDGLSGDLVLPGDERYPQARELQQVEFDAIEPLAVVYCATVADVQRAVRFAAEHDVPVRLRSGGHSHNGWSTGEALIIDVSRLDHVRLTGATVHLGPGLRSVDALDRLGPLGRQIVTGTFPTVAAGGFLAGGGLGWQTRRFGVGSDRLVSAKVVLADGRLVSCSEDEEPDLFWALRGGGGGTFGVVVDYEVRPIAAPALVRYETVWPLARAPELLAAWQDWCVEAPDTLGSSLVVLPSFGPDKPASIRIWGVSLDGADRLGRELAQLAERAAGAPAEARVTGPEPYSEAMHRSLCGELSPAECHRTGTSPVARGHRHPLTLRSYRLTDRAMTAAEASAAVEAWDPSLDQERYLLLIAVGGRANDIDPAATGYVHRTARFLVGYQYALRNPSPEAMPAAWAWTDRTAATLEPVACGSYVNFPSTRPEPDWPARFFGTNLPRLRAVKRAVDPGNFFRHEQSIAP